MSKYKLNLQFKDFALIIFILVLFAWLLSFVVGSLNRIAVTNQNNFAYTIKVKNAYEEIDKVFERSELSANILVDSIATSYDVDRRLDKSYNLNYIKNIDHLVKSVLANSPGISGCWFQINADLPFSVHAFNWYEFRDDQFINLRNEASESAIDRQITPDNDPYYFNAIENGKLTWSDLYTDFDTKEQMVTISTPIYKDGVLIGVVGIDISTVNLQNILGDMQTIIGDSEIYLLDKKNKIILAKSYDDVNITDVNQKVIDLFGNFSNGPVQYSDKSVQKTAIKLDLSNGYKTVIAINNRILFYGFSTVYYLIYIFFALLFLAASFILANHYNKLIEKNPSSKMDESTDNENDSVEE